MIPVSQALDELFNLVSPLHIEHVALRDANNRVLAQTQYATRTQPPVAASSESNGRLHALMRSSRVIPLPRSLVDARACGPRAASTKHPAQQSDDVLRPAPAPPWQPPKHAGKARSTEL